MGRLVAAEKGFSDLWSFPFLLATTDCGSFGGLRGRCRKFFLRLKFFTSNEDGGGQADYYYESTIRNKAGPSGGQLRLTGGALPPDVKSCKRRKT